MKRIFCVLLALMMASSISVAEEGDWYLETAMELAACAGALAGDTGYVLSMTSSEEISALLLPFANAASMQSNHAWKMASVSEASLNGLVNLTLGADCSDAAREKCLSSLPSTLGDIQNGMFGAEAIAAATIATFTRTYIMPEDFTSCAYLLQYGDARFFVSFSATGSDTITVSAQPLFTNSADEFLLEPSHRLFYSSPEQLF